MITYKKNMYMEYFYNSKNIYFFNKHKIYIATNPYTWLNSLIETCMPHCNDDI